MATYGLIADIHGNLEALHAALVRLEREGVDRIVALGDLVGYNAHANECIEVIRAAGIECIAGNHDLIAQGQLGFDRCAMRPEFALRRTRRDLDRNSLRFLASLPVARIYEERVVLIHGGVDDVCEYLRTPADIARNAARLHARVPAARVCFFGHTHAPRSYELSAAGAQPLPLAQDGLALDPGTLSFVNPGSVDAARRDEKVAEVAIFDSVRFTVRHLRLGYDAENAEREAAASGYRMSRVDELLYRARRLVKSGGRKAARAVRAALVAR